MTGSQHPIHNLAACAPAREPDPRGVHLPRVPKQRILTCPSPGCAEKRADAKALQDHCRVAHGLRVRSSRANSVHGVRTPRTQEQLRRSAQRRREARARLALIDFKTLRGVSLSWPLLPCVCLGLEAFEIPGKVNDGAWMLLLCDPPADDCPGDDVEEKHAAVLSRISFEPHHRVLGIGRAEIIESTTRTATSTVALVEFAAFLKPPRFFPDPKDPPLWPPTSTLIKTVKREYSRVSLGCIFDQRSVTHQLNCRLLQILWIKYGPPSLLVSCASHARISKYRPRIPSACIHHYSIVRAAAPLIHQPAKIKSLSIPAERCSSKKFPHPC